MWKEIRKDWEILHLRVGFIVWNGRKVQFWKDAWSEEVELSTLFLSLFALAVHKEASVVNVWDKLRNTGGGGGGGGSLLTSSECLTIGN